MLTTPQGKLSRYFYGVDYPARDLRLGLIEASENKIGSPVDQLLLYCYHYDPATGKYGAAVMNIDAHRGRGHSARNRGDVAAAQSAQSAKLMSSKTGGAASVMQSWIPLVPDSASTFSGKVDALYFYLSGVTLFFTLLISAVLIFFVIRYRRRTPYEIPRPVAGSHKLETLWSVIPFIIAMTHVWLGRAGLFRAVQTADKCD